MILDTFQLFKKLHVSNGYHIRKHKEFFYHHRKFLLNSAEYFTT